MEKVYYSYEMFKNDVNILSSKINDFNPEVVLAVARGGLTLGHFICNTINNRNLFSINSISYNNEIQLSSVEVFNIPDLSAYKKIVIVDDIVDSGKTLLKVIDILNDKFPNLDIKIASIYYKDGALLKPDFYIRNADCWIDFFWEIDTRL